MRVLITSGGTTEKIDQVRGISNFATGRLGKIMAERFLAANHDVVLLAGHGALIPDPHPLLSVIRISDVSDLAEKVASWVPQADVLVHSMAVSDYSPIYMTDFDTVAQHDHLEDFLSQTNNENKISSQPDYQVLFLKKTPKIISSVKKHNPSIILIGFKLLVDVPQADLISVARASLLKNQADYILANDLTQITEHRHHGLLVSRDTVLEGYTKQEIASLILKESEATYDKHHTSRNW